MSEDETETPGIAGGCALIVLAGGAVVILAIVSPGAAVLALWVVGTGALWRAVRKPVQGAANPSPEEGVETVDQEEPQVNKVTVTKVGDAGIVVSHPSERRTYRVESCGTPDA